MSSSDPAFPHTFKEFDGGDSTEVAVHGLTKREWFAGQALSGLLATGCFETRGHDVVAGWAILCADAMLKRLGEN